MKLHKILSNAGLLRAVTICAIIAFAFLAHTTADSGTHDIFMTPTVHAAEPNSSTGIVPCGRETDNPETENDETNRCSFCHLALIANNLVLFFFSIASLLAVLMFIVAAFMYVFVGANPVSKNQAKEAAMNVVKGYLIVFVAWLIVDFVLSAWGFIDPLGGSWSVVCE
jgi:hypothetical protein